MFRVLIVIALVGGISCTSRTQRLTVVPRLDGRIVGGNPTKIDYFPHQISLQRNGRHICGGSLISKTTVLTAGHCTEGFAVSSLSIRAGSSYHARGGQIARVKSVFQHPLFNANTLDYDVSVLQLSTSVNQGGTAKIISLQEKDIELIPGTEAAVSGWGATIEGGFIPSILQFLRVPIISRSKCNEAYKGEGEVTDRQICAGYVGIGGKDSCQGDSGGPLIQNGKQIGIVSWGNGCARKEYPGVYSNIANLRAFIDEHTN